jgi:hypothetical protein
LQGQRNVILEWAGRSSDLSCGVRYGIVGEQVAGDEPGTAEEGAGQPGQDIPDEARKQVVEALDGGPFLVFRDKVQEELKLSDDQKQKLMEKFPDHAEATRKVFEKIKDLKPEEREKEMQSHRQKAPRKTCGASQGDPEGGAAQAAPATGTATTRTVEPGPARDRERAENHGRATEAVHGRRWRNAQEDRTSD